MSQAERFTIAKLRYAGGSEHFVRYVSEVHYDAALAREAVLQQRLTAVEQGLKFYADGDHLLLADADAWDTCSGEPVNFLHDEAGTASVEDGSIAKAALKPAAEVAKNCPNCKVCMGSPGFPENCLINGLKP